MSLRLLKVVVQPTFVEEDEEGCLTELVAQPVVVTAKDWPSYPAAFARMMVALEAQRSVQQVEQIG